MTTRETIGSLLVWLLLPLNALAEGVSQELKAYTDLMEWLRQTLQRIRELGDHVDKMRLVTYLDDLERNFEDMLWAKSNIKKELDKKPLDQRRLGLLVRRMQGNVTNLGESVRNVSFLVKQQPRGNEIAQELTRAFHDKETWLEKLDRIVILSEEEIAMVSSDVEKSYTALNKADADLGELVKQLKAQP
jgi:hypothetical protein